MKFLSIVLAFLTTSLLLARSCDGIVVGSPTLDGSKVYPHLVVVGVPLPSNVTASEVWSSPSISPYLKNATLYTNWTSAQGNTTGNNILQSLDKANISYTVYADNVNNTSSLFITQLARLGYATNVNELETISQLQTDAQSGKLPAVSFFNSSLLNISTLGTYLQQSQPLVSAFNITALYTFIPANPSGTQTVALPNFITGYGITASNDTVSHNEADVANAIAAIYLKNFPQLQSYGSLKKLFTRARNMQA